MKDEIHTNQGRVKCRKCDTAYNLGIFRCSECNISLRPIFLNIATIVGPILASISIVVYFVQREKLLHLIGIGDFVFGLLSSIASIIVLVGLRHGRYWAWVAIHVIWAIDILFLIINGQTNMKGMAIQLSIILFLFMYVHSYKVQEFCSIGRPLKST